MAIYNILFIITTRQYVSAVFFRQTKRKDKHIYANVCFISKPNMQTLLWNKSTRIHLAFVKISLQRVTLGVRGQQEEHLFYVVFLQLISQKTCVSLSVSTPDTCNITGKRS